MVINHGIRCTELGLSIVKMFNKRQYFDIGAFNGFMQLKVAELWNSALNSPSGNDKQNFIYP